jgi:hypothetical protein
MYKNPSFLTPFQVLVAITLSLREREISDAPVLLAERGFASALHVFSKSGLDSGALDPKTLKILEVLFKHLVASAPSSEPDLVVYCRLDQPLTENHKRNQSRPGGEHNKVIPPEVLERLHRFHEYWLGGTDAAMVLRSLVPNLKLDMFNPVPMNVDIVCRAIIERLSPNLLPFGPVGPLNVSDRGLLFCGVQGVDPSEHNVAGGLNSKPDPTAGPLSSADWREFQEKDPDLALVRSALLCGGLGLLRENQTCGLLGRAVLSRKTEPSLCEGLVCLKDQHRTRIVVPAGLQKLVVSEAHAGLGAAHGAQGETLRRVSQHYWFPDL